MPHNCLQKAKINANFVGANLQNCDFTGAIIDFCDFTNAQTEHIILTDAIITNTPTIDKNFVEEPPQTRSPAYTQAYNMGYDAGYGFAIKNPIYNENAWQIAFANQEKYIDIPTQQWLQIPDSDVVAGYKDGFMHTYTASLADA
jgi:hypothetical protein